MTRFHIQDKVVYILIYAPNQEAHGITLQGMYTVTRVQIVNKAVFISHSTNTLGKYMHPTILPTTMNK